MLRPARGHDWPGVRLCSNERIGPEVVDNLIVSWSSMIAIG
jgi:hypothetical protein